MTYENAKSSLDDDTQVILEIAVKFLCDYFGHSRPTAEHLIAELLRAYPEMYDADFIHRESPYGVAAGAHYLCVLGGNRSGLRNWMSETGHNRTPPEALEYFRRTYFLPR